LDYRDATVLYATPAQGIRFPVYPALNEADQRSSKRATQAGAKAAFRVSVPVLSGLVQLTDGVLLLGAIVAAAWLHTFASIGARNQDVLTAVIAAGVTALSLRIGRGYALQTLRSAGAQAKVISISLALGLATIFSVLLVLGVDQAAEQSWALQWLLAASSLLILSRLILACLIRRWERAEGFTRTLAVVGDADLGCDILVRALAEASDDHVVGVYEDRLTPAAASAGDIGHLITRCRQERIDAIVIAVPTSESKRIADITRQLSVVVSDIYLAMDVAALYPSGQQITRIANGPAVLLNQRPLKDWEALQKRAFDVVLAGILLLFLAPFMGLIALAIKLDSRGPVLFRQPRFGFNNTMFDVYKFRSMHHDMADILADQQTKKDDKRITRVGKWLRKLSLDELPQLQNVLSGEMSLVGPRPHAPNTKAGGRRFTEIMPEKYALRHRVRPGITGWAQVNGWRGETQTVEQLEKRVACDLHYIENWSLLFDAKILLLTLRRGIASPQAY